MVELSKLSDNTEVWDKAKDKIPGVVVVVVPPVVVVVSSSLKQAVNVRTRIEMKRKIESFVYNLPFFVFISKTPFNI